MKFATALSLVMLFVPVSHTASECHDAQGKSKAGEQAQCAEASLPEEALAEVRKLRVDMRYFMAVGFHHKAKEKRAAIAAVYREHGVALPDEYHE